MRKLFISTSPARSCSRCYLDAISTTILILLLTISIGGSLILNYYSAGATAISLLITLGVFSIIIAICGFFGSAYNPEKGSRFCPCLVIFSVMLMLLSLLFLLLMAASFSLRPGVTHLFTLDDRTIKERLPWFAEGSIDDIGLYIQDIRLGLAIAGIVFVFLSVLAISGFVVSLYHLGTKLFLTVCFGYFS